MLTILENDGQGHFVPLGTRTLDATRIDFHELPHSNSTMLKRGVYPAGTTRQQVEELVSGTFGGRFESFGEGKFVYVAYTD